MGDEWIITNLISPGFDSQSCLEDEPIITLSPTLTLPNAHTIPTLYKQNDIDCYSNSKLLKPRLSPRVTGISTSSSWDTKKSFSLSLRSICLSCQLLHQPLMPTLVIRKRDVTPVYNDTQKNIPNLCCANDYTCTFTPACWLRHIQSLLKESAIHA